MIPRWPKPEAITLVVAGGRLNAFFQVANMSSRESISIDNWI
jgi:hypothetical protein